jgi:hypothetical protein
LIFPIYRGQIKFLSGEMGVIEILQGVVLLVSLFLNLKLRSRIKRKINTFFMNLRVFLIAFLFYEEISFILNKLFKFRNPYNWQSEFNIHNSKFLLKSVVENIYLPFLDFKFSIPLDFFLIASCLIFIGFGSFIFNSKAVNILFLEKKYAFYSLLFPINFAINSLLLRSKLVDLRIYSSFELIELFIYLIFLLDVYTKIRKYYVN